MLLYWPQVGKSFVTVELTSLLNIIYVDMMLARLGIQQPCRYLSLSCQWVLRVRYEYAVSSRLYDLGGYVSRPSWLVSSLASFISTVNGRSMETEITVFWHSTITILLSLPFRSSDSKPWPIITQHLSFQGWPWPMHASSPGSTRMLQTLRLRTTSL